MSLLQTAVDQALMGCGTKDQAVLARDVHVCDQGKLRSSQRFAVAQLVLALLRQLERETQECACLCHLCPEMLAVGSADVRQAEVVELACRLLGKFALSSVPSK